MNFDILGKRQNCSSFGVKQRGMSVIGAIIILVLVLLVGLVALKIVPAYTENMTVNKILKAMAAESFIGKSKTEIRSMFNKRASIDDIDTVNGDDLEITQDESGKTIVYADYEAIRPITSTINVVIKFHATSEGK